MTRRSRARRLAGYSLMLVAGLATVLVPTTGPAAATTVPGRTTVVAGGPGGPDNARNIAQTPFGVDAVGGKLYVAGGATTWAVGTTGRETPVAGVGVAGDCCDGQRASFAKLRGAFGITADSAGDAVITDTGSSRVRIVAAASGTFFGVPIGAGDIDSVAGNGLAGFSGDGGPATGARLNQPLGSTLDGNGNLVIADTHNQRLRVVAASTGSFYGRAMTAGDIYTVAGTGVAGFSGDSGPAVNAKLQGPAGVTVDHAGNLVVADTSNLRIRVVAASTGSFYGIAMTAGDIYSIAGDGTRGFAGDNGPATSAELFGPGGAAVDAAGNVVIADTGNDRLRVVAGSSATFYGIAMTTGDIYTVAGNGTSSFHGDGGSALAAGFTPEGVAVDASGNLVVADQGNGRVRVVAETSATVYGVAMTAGDVYTVAGNGRQSSGDRQAATAAELAGPIGLTTGASDAVVVTDPGGGLQGRVRVVARTTGTYFGRSIAAGNIDTVAGGGNSQLDGVPARSEHLGRPSDSVLDAHGNLLISDQAFGRVRVVAATSGTFYGQAMTANDIYTIAGGGSAQPGDNGPATSARLSPWAVAVDASGNVVVGDTLLARLRVVAATTGTFYGQAMTAGDIYTVAGNGTFGDSGDGGLATAAELHIVEGVAVDASGNLVLSDTFNNRVRVVAATSGTFYGRAMTAGHIYALAGGGTGGLGDGGAATAAELASPTAVAFDGSGNLVIADTNDDRVRMVAVTSGTFYGVTMTAGDIYTVAGDGRPTYRGNGGAATAASFDLPEGVTIDGGGNLLIADTGNNRIRAVAP